MVEHERKDPTDFHAGGLPEAYVLVAILNELKAIHDHSEEIAAVLTEIATKMRPDGDPAPGAVPAEASPKSERAVPPHKSR